ncbi:hypothetical protein JCM9534A_17390 [Catenuloplanes indicus JCM 9534]
MPTSETWRWTLGRLLTVGCLLTIGPLLLVTTVSYARITTLLADRERMDHSYHILATLSELRHELQDAERGQRGYIITGEPDYLRPYQEAIGKIDATLSDLQSLYATSTQQADTLRSLRQSIDDKRVELARTIALRQESGFAAAQSIVATGQGAKVMERIEARLTAMSQQEQRLLTAGESATRRQARQTTLFISYGTAVAALVAAVGAVWASRKITRPIREVTVVARQITAGDLSRRAPVRGPAEVAEMAAAVNASTAAVVRARDDAVAAEAATAAFLATMSHEIRTPMNAVIGMTGLLLDTELTRQQRDFVDTVRDSGEALLVIINDILDFSKIEAGQLELEDAAFSLPDCIDGALALVAVPAAAKGLELVSHIDRSCPTVVCGDVTRLRQIVANLLSNAVKFTSDGEIVVSVTAEPAGTGEAIHLRVDVRDTGIGIPADRLERLFRPFTQADTSTTREYGGTGLGLAISRRLAHAMGGTLTVTSTEAAGSTFSLTVLVRPHPETTDTAQTNGPLYGQEVLIVEDNASAREALDAQLTAWGLRCTAVATPSAAFDAIDSRDDLRVVLIDHTLPGINGVDLAAILRERHPAEDLPLVLLTSVNIQPSSDERQRFNAVLTKPTRSSTLHTTLMRLLSPATDVPADTTDEPSTNPRSPLRILLAEDNQVNQRVAKLMLAKLGHRVDTVADGAEAVHAVHRAPYDVVLMDMRMPVLDGLAATRIIRAELPADRQPHIIAMTANALAEDRAQCLAAGMDGYLAKPVRAAELSAALAPLLRDAPPPPDTDVRNSADDPQHAHTSTDAGIRERLRDITGPNPPAEERALMARLLTTFPAKTRAGMDKVEAALASGDTAAVRDVAHGLKGSALNVGLRDLAKLFAAIEDHRNDSSESEVHELLDACQETLADAVPVLEQIAGDYLP